VNRGVFKKTVKGDFKRTVAAEEWNSKGEEKRFIDLKELSNDRHSFKDAESFLGHLETPE